MPTKKKTANKTTAKKAPKLTRMQMRVEIARDVLLRLKKKQYKATTGIYTNIAIGKTEHEETAGDLQQILKSKITPSRTCQVCALGSLFLSSVVKFDKCTVPRHLFLGEDYDLTREDFFDQHLGKFFTQHELDFIESMFEATTLHCKDTDIFSQKELDLIDSWPEYFRTPEARLTAIMENIIANNGKFKPSVKIIAS